ncbi:MAG TPA: hypothetical protein VFL84_02710 [Gammaproteobacteria bacterium]|nr:hypothetical protein [Gammaproteobacteria bacterium]
MVTLGMRRLESAAAIAAALVLAVVTSPLVAQSLSADDRELEQIQEILSRDGPYAPELLGPLSRLGLIYQEGEDYALALVTLERAQHIVRVNNGLHSMDQVPVMRQLIAIEDARGNHEGAWDRQQDLLQLLRRHPDDVRTVPVLRDIADKQMEVLASVIAGERPPEVVLGCFYKQWPTQAEGSCEAGSKSTVVQGMLAEAQRTYLEAIAVLLRQGLYDSDDLRAIELQVLRGVDLMRSRYYKGPTARPVPMAPAYVGASNLEPWRSRMAAVAELAEWELPYPEEPSLQGDDDDHVLTKQVHIMDPYHRGRQSLRRLYAYGAASSDSSVEQAEAVAQMADWDLLYSHNGRAIESYDVARGMLDEAGVPASSVEQLFAPPTPVVLPAFQPNPLARDESRVATGYIDVAFEITKYGRSRAVEILDSANASHAAKQDLIALIRVNRYRPQLTDGVFADATPVRLRYYLYEERDAPSLATN